MTTNTANNANGLAVKSNVKAGYRADQHNQTAPGLKLRTNVKAGSGRGIVNHNQTTGSGLMLRTNLKAGSRNLQHNQILR